MMIKWDDICYYVLNLESSLRCHHHYWNMNFMAFCIPPVFPTGVCSQLDNTHFVFWSHINTGCDRFWLMFPLSQARHHSNAIANSESENDEESSSTDCWNSYYGFILSEKWMSTCKCQWQFPQRLPWHHRGTYTMIKQRSTCWWKH